MKINNSSNIIYIIGAGRSGTTLLDIILGNGSGIFSAGELNRFTKRDGIPHDARDKEVLCFWKKVKNALKEKKFDDPGKYYPVSKKYEYHSAFYYLLLPFKHKPSFHTYSAYQKNLFSSLTNNAEEIFGKTIIVDSSKYPMRAFFLSKILGKCISFIYVKRNPAAVVESFQKKEIEQPSKSRLAANLYLLGVNNIAGRVAKILRKTHKVSVVSYEELLQFPFAALTKIESELDIDLGKSKKLIEQNLPLQVGLLFDGNRLRLKEEVIFRKGNVKAKSRKVIDKLFYPLHRLTWYKPVNRGDK